VSELWSLLQDNERALHRALVIVLLCSTVACAGPSTTRSDYRDKAAQTAQSMRSLLATASLAIEGARAGRQTSPFTNVILTEAETDARAVQASFATRQPPVTGQDDLRADLDRLLTQATAALGDARIAARRSDTGAMEDTAQTIDDLRRKLLPYEHLAVT
jgi:hypothetical protein